MVLESNTLDVLFVKDGQQGEDGKVLYTWIKYAKDANGTGMTDDPNGAIYIGISYNNESSIESNDPTQYAWTKIQGADGKKGEDAYTIFLENENISFATDKNRNPLSEQAYTSGITIMKGAKPVTDFTIGDIVKTQGIAVAKTDTAIAISVVNGNPLPNDSGEIEIPITVGGTVFKKILTWTCAKKGDQGERGLQGIQGPQGEQGIAGKDGTSVTITNKSITYQLSTSGTTIPTGTWQTTPQAIPEGQYQWTKTSVTYSDGNKTESYSISYHGKNGSDGTSVKTTSTSVKYQVGDSGTTKPTGTWQSNVPTVAQGKYLWTQTIVNYSDGNSTESYSVSYKGIDGSNGVNGMNAATIYLYQRATSTPSKPSNTLTYTFSTTKISGTLNNGWSTAIPTGTDAVYVTVASVSSKNDTATIATSAWSAPVVLAQNGKTGSDGKAGLNVATIYLYQRNTSKPSKPSASVTYTFSTGVASGLNNGWSQKIPDGTNPLYVTLATASSNTATDTILSSEWSDVVVMAQNGEDGQDGISPKVSLSKSGNTTTISIVDATGTHTQTVKDGTNGTPGEAGKDGKTSYFHVKYSNDGGKTFTGNSGEDTGIYMGSYTDYTEGDSTDVSKYTWVRVKGEDGAGFHWNLVKGTDTPKEFQPYSGVNVGCTFYEIDFRDKTINSDDKFAISFDFEWTQFTQNNNGTFDWWFQGAVNKGWDEGNPFTYIVGQVIKKNMSKITDGAGSYHVECYASGIESKLYDFGVRFDNSDGTGKVKISNFKLEEGDKPSPWCTTYEETLAKNLSITPSSQYFKSTDGGKTFVPDTITIKPTIQGEINFGKWQYSIDGGVSFADVVSGQKGLTISNNVLTVGKDSSLYSDAVTMVTFRAVANDSSFYDTCSIAKIYDVSDIGDGRNLLTGVSSYTKDAPFEKTDSRADGWIVYQNIITSIELEAGKKYVLQAKTDGNWAADHNTNGQDPSKKLVTLWLVSDKTNDCFDMRQGYVVFTPAVTAKYKLRVNQYSNGTDAYTIHLWDIKLEKGSFPTGWTPAPEDLQTAILSTKSEISDVSLKVDNNKQAIEQRVEKTTYQQDLNLVKGDISKANEGLNKWRYEIYPKSLFASEYQGKSTMDVFAKNTNLTPSQSVLINDTDFGKSWAYGDNYIGYALTFVKFSAAKSIAITFKHDDGAHLYLNGKLIGGDDTCNTGSGESLTLSFIQGWNCLEVVLNEKSGGEYIGLGTTISAISECQLMNCYYGTPVARQSHITNQLVENTTNIDGVSGSVQKVMSTVGGSSKIDEFVNNYSTWKKKVDGIETRVGETYTTKSDFNGLEIGGRNLLKQSSMIGEKLICDGYTSCNNCNIAEYTNEGFHIITPTTGNANNGIAFCFYNFTILGINGGDTITFSCDIKGTSDSHAPFVSIRISDNNWYGSDVIQQNTSVSISSSWQRVSTTITVPTGLSNNHMWLAIHGNYQSDLYIKNFKLEKGNKATDWTPALEDNEINGQNLVSNLPTNWEQGSVQCNTGSIYSGIKTATTTRLRVKDVFSVSGNVTISAGASTNSSKEDLNFYYVLFDVNKKEISNSSTWQSLTSAKIINCGDAKYMAIILRWGSATTMMNPSDISQIRLKIERGTSATPFTLAPEDVNGKIVNVETIANQTAKKFEWIVKGGDSSSNFTLTDRVADLVAERINFKGLVTFSGLNTDAKNEIGKVAQSKVDGLEIGGRNLIINSNLSRTLTNVTNDGCSNMTVVSDSVYGHALKFTAVNQRRVFWATSNVWVKNKTYTVSFVAKSSVTGQKIRPSRSTADWGDDITLTTSYARYTTKITSLDTNAGGTLSFSCTNAVGDITITNVKLEVGNKATDWTPAPEDVSQDATNKASQALTDAKNYSSNAVNWVTNNGSSTTSLNSMVKKWTDGAVSDTAQINGGWIKANTITASKIALADFTNYSQLTRDTADAYGFTVTDDTDGTWFSTKNIKRDQFISEIFPCNGGESYLIEYDISTNAKGANNSTDTKNYIGVAIGVYGYTGTVGSNGLPNKATNIWYADRITGSETAPSIHVKTTITTSTATKQFRVFLQSNGYYFEGTTKIRNLSVRRMYGGTLIVDGSITADKIATDAIKSRNYISSGGTQGSFLNLSDGSFQSPNLSWDSNGNLIAKNANISGQITATDGSIGKFKITDQWLITGSGNTCAGLGGSGQAFWAGAENSTVAPFRVGYDGSFISSNADISGKITATNGKIGRYDITSTYLMTNSGSNASGIGGNQAFWAGAEDSNSAPFRVGYDGVLWAENAAIRGSIETGNLGDEGDTVVIMNGHIGIQGTSNNVEIYSTGFKFGIDGDYYLESVSDGVKCYRNLYATDLKASGWLYASEVHSSGAVVIASDSESFYWAHGYQIARGTSWGGVCIGDDSQGLRLYGTSIWASHGISTSDENLKENFTTLDQYEDFYMNLNPIGFNYIGDYDGKKTHFGFGAHKTEDILESEGYDSDKFAVVTHRPLVQEDIEKRFGKDVEVDIETEYGISYTEFIALNTHMIQKTRRELTKVKQEKADLETRLQAIEVKLGL